MKSDEFVTILLVEDNPTDAELTLLALREKNLANNVVWLKDGAEALDFIFARGAYSHRSIEQHPKVILLDLKMPKIGGIEVLKTLRANEKTARIPVVVLTSSKEDKDIISSYNLGVNSYIVKPVDFEQFNESIKEIGYYWLIINQAPIKKGNKDAE